MILTEGSLLS